jgi:excinuclease ABC subunit A
MKDKITIKGAKEHNLKNINLDLPRHKMIVFTGLSGSGKSSLAFDTIFAEGQRRYIESLSAYARQFLGQMQKPDVEEIEGLSPAISIDQKAHSANPRSTVATITEIYDYLRVLYARIGEPYCPVCDTKIEKMTVEEMVDIIDKEVNKVYKNKKWKDKETTILAPIVQGRKGEYYQMLYNMYNEGFMHVRVDGKMKKLSEKIILDKNKRHEIDLVTDLLPKEDVTNLNKDKRQRLSESIENALDYGNGILIVKLADGKEKFLSAKFSCPKCGFSFPEIEPRLFSFNSPYGACPTCHGLGTESLFSNKVCPDCSGKRLRREALSVYIGKKNIFELVNLDIENAINFFLNIKLSKTQKVISDAVMKEIINRLQFMMDVGLEYLTLNRKAGTLSGGEAQRIRLASQVGSQLVGALYVLDEPTIGLHQRDNDRLIDTLKNLRDIGNTIIVVEHDEDTIRAADYLVDFGPGAGKHGGEIVCSGEIPKIFDNKKSLTTAYLRGDTKIPIPINRRKNNKDALKIYGAKQNNLQNIDIEIPLRRFVCITGVSGSGKSSLAYDILYTHLANRLNSANHKKGNFKKITGLEYLDKSILMDQSPIGRTPRSNPATYTGIFTHIRELFAATPEARFRNYLPGRFSFNVPNERGGGRCEHCRGHGHIAVEMHFLPTVYVQCDICKGKRFDRETLEVHYKKKNVAEILAMNVEEAFIFFKDIPHLKSRLKVLKEVGLGYIELGQAATTLSGGEAQRVKLSNELGKKSTGKTFYLFDEPTTGLHFDDVRQLLNVLHRLVFEGNSIVVIEHNLDVIKTADYIIDLGPEGGNKGGTIIATGTPEEIVRNPKSYTGKYLKKYL